MVSKWIINDGIMVWYNGPEWDEVAQKAFEESKDQVESYARDNAPWEDRTGDARAGLTAEVMNTDGTIVMFLFHTVEYGRWLETIQNGNFAIILPTLEAMGPRVFAEATEQVRNARSGDDF